MQFHPTLARRTRLIILTLSLTLALSLAAPLWAAGRTEEEDFQQVEGTGNWEYTIDVSDREPGKYNILVRTRDVAGNEALAGPYNVFVDPNSDLPTVSVSYPTPNQAVGERVFVVGTARDDDAVSHVEVQVNDGRFVRAEGQDYWSVLLPMANLPDGPHTIRVRAVDVNGVEGVPTQVSVRLDTTVPVSVAESHESGVLVSRRTTVEGTVQDANGIASLTLVAGEEERRLRLKGGRDEAPRFSFEIDPREMEEGATVWWLESVDGTGARGVTPFLFFVDTSPPELEVLYPAEDDRVDSQLRFAGRVFDLVGIASLAYELSTGEAGEIELTPGDPYWSLAVDLPPGSRGNVTAEFTVTDVAGNERSERVRLTLNAEGDLPTVALASPAEAQTVERPVLAGHALDDDGVSRVIYSLDGGPEQEVRLREEASEGFAVELAGLAPGAHEIRLRAVDRYGTEGAELRRRFTVATPLPSIGLTGVVRGETEEPYAPGFTLAAGERASLVGQLRGEALPSRVSYVAGASAGSAAVDAGGRVIVPLPRSDVGDPVRVELYYANEVGRVARTTGFYVQLPPATEGAAAPVAGDLLSPGLYLTAGEATPPEGGPRIDEAPVTLSRGDSIRLLAVGGRPTDPELSGGHDFLGVSTEGDYVVLRATGDGTITGLRITAAVGGASRSSAPVDLVTEHAPPVIAVPESLVGRRVAELPEIVVGVEDATGVSRVSVAVAPADAAAESAGGGATATATDEGFAASPSLPAQEGPALVRIVAEDAGGASASLLVPIVVDRTAPGLEILTPPDDATVNGTITVLALLSEPASTSEIAVIADDPEASPSTLPPDLLVSHRVVTGESRRSVTFRLVDAAGNTSEQTVDLRTDLAADLPVLQLQVPVEDGLVKEEFRISGVLLDDDAPASITYRVADREPVTIETDGTFDIDVPMRDLADGRHSVSVYGTDIGGARSETIERSFAISRSQPQSTVTAPGIEEYRRGVVVVSGTSTDPNGIASVSVSTDNGASYQLANGTEEWAYQLDTTLLDDGTHSVLVLAADGAGETSLLSTTINVDNTSPVLELTEPDDGVTVSGRFLIDGRGEDDALLGVRLVAQPLASAPGEGTDATGAQPPIVLASFDEPGPFAYVVNASALPPGWYNLRVEAEDRAGNTRRISRNLRVEPPRTTEAPQIIVPLDGAALSHRFRVTVTSPPAAGPVTLLANGRPVGVIEIGDNGIGSMVVEPGTLAPGEVELTIRTEAGENSESLASTPHVVTLSRLGAWVVVDQPQFLSYVRGRPFITGTAGYELALPEGEDRETEQARDELVRSHQIERVEVSLDNGRTFQPARGTDEWEYRLETTVLPDGRHNLIVRARFADGRSAVERYSVVVDEAPPEVRLLEPQERDTFDESVRIVGISTDENAIADVSVVLREGDKARYEVPSFIQGLYVDLHAMGATVFDVGAGLTFFDNNVRLQAQVGRTPRTDPPERFNGLVLGAKLLANVAALPASFILGPDFDWLSAAVAVGANFSYYTMSENTIGFTEDGLTLASMVAQLEFPIVTVPDLAFFNTYAFYTEAQLWFISSDIDAGTEFRLAFGVRADVF